MLFDDEMEELLKSAHVIAVVGLSPEEGKASNSVARYLKDKGYRIIPVNPGHEEILGEKAYKSLLDIPEKVDIVDIFMRAEKVLPFVEEALKLKPKAIWLQLGIRNDERQATRRENGYRLRRGQVPEAGVSEASLLISLARGWVRVKGQGWSEKNRTSTRALLLKCATH